MCGGGGYFVAVKRNTKKILQMAHCCVFTKYLYSAHCIFYTPHIIPLQYILLIVDVTLQCCRLYTVQGVSVIIQGQGIRLVVLYHPSPLWLYSNGLHYLVLDYNTLCWTTPHCFGLHYIVLDCTTLF